MRIGCVSDSLANMTLDAALTEFQALGIEGIELNTGNWSSAPHCDLSGLLADSNARAQLLSDIAERGLELFALNANGNQLHPTEGRVQSACLHNTIRLAGALGVETVVCMSGLPGGAPGDQTPNWIVSSWPPETQSILEYQWNDVALPYWAELVALAKREGVERLALELHGNQLVYNAPTLLRLRKEMGPMVGANLDPSHMMWMGGDPLAAIDLLGEATYHVHAKDTYINEAQVGTRTRLENGPLEDLKSRSWWYVTLGYGHDEKWWRNFCYRLRMANYDGWLSIEHEDVALSCREGLQKSVELLRNVVPKEASDYEPPEI